MRKICQPLIMAALAAFVVAAPPFAATGLSQQAKPSRFAVPVGPQQAATLKREEDLALDQAESAVREMLALARTQPEKQLADNDARIVAEIRRLVLRRQATRSSPATPAGAEQMQEMQASFNLQYLELQSQMQHESRQFAMVSNIMKTKHDTVKNSIDNIR